MNPGTKISSPWEIKMKYIVLSAFFVSLFLNSCSNSHNSGYALSPLIETQAFVSDGNGSIQYYTNDQARMNHGYYHIYSSSLATPMTTVEVKVKKMSGDPHAGYGIVFCSADVNNFYRIVVTISGYYQIARKEAGTYSVLVDWTHTNWLTGVYDIDDTLTVTKSGADSFDLYINNNYVTTFTDATFDGGSAGFYASVSPNEDFPTTAVDVRFQMLQPIFIP
jgi:hypothetical protein